MITPEIPDSPFARFVIRHEEANRWFRSTNIAYRMTRLHCAQQNETDLAQSIIPVKLRWRHTFQHYPGPLKEGVRTPRATIADLVSDLRENGKGLLEATIVREVGALEIFLREWALAALSFALDPSITSHTSERVRKLEETRKSILDRPYQSVSLARIVELFPAIGAVLSQSTHLRAVQPLLGEGSGDLNCQVVALLWRDVRNLILHHDRIVHQRFIQKFGPLWLAIQTDAKNRGKTIIPRPCRVGRPLPLVERHLVFCFTTCYQLASVLESVTRTSQRNLIPPDKPELLRR